MTCARAALMTIGQLAFYDQIKALLLTTPYFDDNVITHVTASLLAVSKTYTQLATMLETLMVVNFLCLGKTLGHHLRQRCSMNIL